MWFAVIGAFFSLGYAATPDGVIVLNEDNFDKVIREDLHVMMKFDKKYSWGSEEDSWNSFTEQAVKNQELLLVEVHLDEDNKDQNKDLAKRYEADSGEKEDWPLFRVLKKGSKTEYVKFEGEVTQDALLKFVTSNTGIWIGGIGCLEEFDGLAKEFTAAEETERSTILEKAKKLQANYVGGDMDKKRAKYYVKAMIKIMNDDGHLEKETNRIHKVMTKGNMNAEQKKWADNRLNILVSFGAVKPAIEEEETDYGDMDDPYGDHYDL